LQPVIRSASLADASAISELVCRVAAATIFANGPEDGRRYFMAMNTPAAVAGKMNDDAYRYYVAEQDGRMVGMIAIRGNAHLYHLFIDDSMHRSGLGRRLWDHARGEAARNGNRGRFTVNATPDTTGFYERLGFKVSGEMHVRNGHPAIPMTLDPFG
jgi:GNAT superfamily N-acetyltransferase